MVFLHFIGGQLCNKHKGEQGEREIEKLLALNVTSQICCSPPRHVINLVVQTYLGRHVLGNFTSH